MQNSQPFTATGPHTTAISTQRDSPPGTEHQHTPARTHTPHTRRRNHDELFQVSPISSEQDSEYPSLMNDITIPLNHVSPAQHRLGRCVPIRLSRAFSALETFGLLRQPQRRRCALQSSQPVARAWHNHDLHLISANFVNSETVELWRHGWEPALEAHAVQEKFKHKRPLLVRIFSFLRPVLLVPPWLTRAVWHACARTRPSNPTWCHRIDGIHILITPYPMGRTVAHNDWATPPVWLHQIKAIVPGSVCPLLRAAGCVTVFQFSRGSVVRAEAWVTPDGILRLCANDSYWSTNPTPGRLLANVTPWNHNPTLLHNRSSHLPIAASSTLIHTIEHKIRASERARHHALSNIDTHQLQP